MAGLDRMETKTSFSAEKFGLGAGLVSARDFLRCGRIDFTASSPTLVAGALGQNCLQLVSRLGRHQDAGYRVNPTDLPFVCLFLSSFLEPMSSHPVWCYEIPPFSATGGPDCGPVRYVSDLEQPMIMI